MTLYPNPLSIGESHCQDTCDENRCMILTERYPPEQKKDYSSTSLICSGKDGFYQIRNGKKGGFFHFSKKERSWTKILETPYTLNTLAIGDDNKACLELTEEANCR